MSTYKEVVLVRREFYNPTLPSEIINASKAFLGSVFKDRVPYRPDFTKQELDEILYPYMDVKESDRDFRKRVNEFWADMQILVDSAGIPLNITMYDEVTPANTRDWVYWRWAKEHPQVASSEKEMLGNPLYKYYLRDPEKELANTAQSGRTLREAQVIFDKILTGKNPIPSMQRIVQMMNTNPHGMNAHNLEVTVNNFINDAPTAFLAIVKDKDLQLKARILDMVNLDILRREGNHFVFIDKPIGANIDQAVIWFKDQTNAGDVNLLNAQYEEKTKDRDLQNAQ